MILRQIEERYDVADKGGTVPERVKELRRQAIARLDDGEEDETVSRQLEEDLDNLFLVVQLFSYPGNYVAERPSVERLAETLDKLEEDVLGASTAGIRAARRAVLAFGEPIPVESGSRKRDAVQLLTRTLEERVQALLDQMNAEQGAKPASTQE